MTISEFAYTVSTLNHPFNVWACGRIIVSLYLRGLKMRDIVYSHQQVNAKTNDTLTYYDSNNT